jgi:putative flavoprotein involved in K+ transport
MSTTTQAVVVGGGQAGLAAAHALRQSGLAPVILEAGLEPVGSWPHYYDSLTLFSPARYSSLPGMPFPGDPRRYPHRDDVVAYLREYAKTLDVEIRTGQPVNAVHASGSGYSVTTEDGTIVSGPIVIAATGGFTRPYQPDLPGLETFTGQVLHAGRYRRPEPFAGRRIVVVGAGNSAVQIAVELAAHARVTLATRKPISFVRQRPLGRDLHFWFNLTGIDRAPIGSWLRATPSVPVFDTGTYRSAVLAGRPDQQPMFTAVTGDEVIWSDGRRERVDVILLATGYRPDLRYLAPLGILDPAGHPVHRNGISTTAPGLGFVGLEWQRTLSSASVRGVGRDAAYVVRHLTRSR